MMMLLLLLLLLMMMMMTQSDQYMYLCDINTWQHFSFLDCSCLQIARNKQLFNSP